MQKSLNDITKEDLLLVEELASYFFTPREIAIMIEVNADSLVSEIETEDTTLYNAFQKGRLQSEMELKKSIITLARAGSSPAQTMAMDLLMKSKIKMLDQ